MSNCSTSVGSGGCSDKVSEVCISNNGTIPDDYVASYRFNGNVEDDSGNNDAVNNGCEFVENRAGEEQSALFCGGSGYAESIISDISSDTSLSLWIKPTSTLSGQFVFEAKSTVGYVRLYFFNDNEITVSIKYQFGPFFKTKSHSQFFDALEWSHIGISIGDFLDLYINGSLVYTVGMGDFSSVNLLPCTLTMGADNSKSEYFHGAIDDFRVYDKALSSGLINTLYLERYGASKFNQTSSCKDVVSKECFKGDFEQWVLDTGVWEDKLWTTNGIWKTI